MINLHEPPNSPPYFELTTGQWIGMEGQRNLLLYFLQEQGLEDKFKEFLDKHYPEDADGYRGNT